jgi:hypothetical protein
MNFIYLLKQDGIWSNSNQGSTVPGKTQNSEVLLAIMGMVLEGKEFRANVRQVTLNVGET